MESELTVRVKLIFQPSEENTKGAKQIISQGILEDVDEVEGAAEALLLSSEFASHINVWMLPLWLLTL